MPSYSLIAMTSLPDASGQMREAATQLGSSKSSSLIETLGAFSEIILGQAMPTQEALPHSDLPCMSFVCRSAGFEIVATGSVGDWEASKPGMATVIWLVSTSASRYVCEYWTGGYLKQSELREGAVVTWRTKRKRGAYK